MEDRVPVESEGQGQLETNQVGIERLQEEAENARSEIERLEQELSEKHNRYLRLLADFDNYRKRVEREAAEITRAGKRELLLGLIEIIDNFERALKAAQSSNDGLVSGLRSIHRQMASLLESHNVRRFESLGNPFDPHLHEAVGSVEVEGPPGQVVEVLQEGYLWDDNVLRPARVLVSR